MSRQLVVCGIGSGMESAIPRIARDHDLAIIAITDRPTDLDGLPVDQILVAYPRDAAAVLDAVAQTGIEGVDAVMSLGYENPPVISRLARLWSCPGVPVEVADRCTYKDLRIAALEQAGVRTPRFRVFRELAEAAEAAGALGFPTVVKPTDGTSSVGVSVVRDANRLPEAVSDARKATGRDALVIEQFVEGTEHTVEGIVVDGVVQVAALSDRNYDAKHRFAPFVFEAGDDLPSAAGPKERAALEAAAAAAVSALGIDDSVFSTDLLLTLDGVYVLEVAARLSGSRFGTHLVPLASGVDIVDAAVRLALGEVVDPTSLVATESTFVASRYLPSATGVVTYVGDLAAQTWETGVVEVFWEQELEVGQVLDGYRSAKDMLASAIAWGTTRAEAAGRADRALAGLPLEIGLIGVDDV